MFHATIGLPPPIAAKFRRMKEKTMIDFTRKLIGALIKDERGLTAVEYAVLGAIVVAAITAVGTAFQADLATAFGNLFV